MPPSAREEAPPPDAPTDRFRIRVAVLIAVVSILGAVGAWRGSVSSIHASALDQEAEQQLVQQQQREAALVGKVANDLQVFARYQEHVKAWRMLSAKAAAVSASNTDLSASFDAQAQAELSLARSLRPFFEAGTPDFGNDRGTVVYEPAYVLRNLEQGDPDLAVLRPDETFAEAQGAHTKTVDLVGIVALFIAAVFLLTVAQFAGPGVRTWFAGAGVAVTVAAIAFFLAAEITL